MTRPLRLEFPGAVYHVTSRGDRSELIYRDDVDRRAWLDAMQLVCKRFNFLVHAFCQMSNHYHLVLETTEGNLSQGMRLLNGAYTQHFNRRHAVAGHLFQGRYNAILVQKESYLLELTRYVVLNPVRAGMVRSPHGWPWSSHHFMLARKPAPAWLATDWLLAHFGSARSDAARKYTAFIAEGIAADSPFTATSHRLILGDEAFVERHQKVSSLDPLRDVARTQRRAVVLSLEEYRALYADEQEAMARAYFSTAYSMAQIGGQFGVSARTVSRAVHKFEE